ETPYFKRFDSKIMSFFNGKVALITGSSNGISRASAVLFAKHGAKVVITEEMQLLSRKRRCCAYTQARKAMIFSR
ncbi:hypothetical protein PENTCL1PPCAC_30363, partial [Pristionchus entomophagus]